MLQICAIIEFNIQYLNNSNAHVDIYFLLLEYNYHTPILNSIYPIFMYNHDILHVVKVNSVPVSFPSGLFRTLHHPMNLANNNGDFRLSPAMSVMLECLENHESERNDRKLP